MTRAFDCDVLVVGLGPVGAALSALLIDRGLKVIAIDKDSLVYPLPRAAHFDHEIMRLFQQLGVADEVARHARAAPAYEFRNAAGEVLMHFDLDAAGSPSGWPTSFMFHQPGMENALRARLAASPLADVRLERAFSGLTQDADGVLATIDGPAGAETLRTRYLVGCDGAWSPVREALGVTLDDYQFDEPWLVLDVLVGEAKNLPDLNLQICDPARPTTCVLMGPGRHRWEFMLLPGETAEQVTDEAFIRKLLQPWNCADDVVIERKAVYRFHGLVAKTWRAGRVLIAGDAAHQTPPFAGQGMCSGLRDAANLAWKLAAVIGGHAAEALLDTYQPEREPHTRALIERAIHMGRVVCTADKAAAAARDASMLAQRRAGKQAPLPEPPDFTAGFLLAGSPGAGEVFPQPWATAAGVTLRMDDVLGDGPWLISRSRYEPAQSTPPTLALALDDGRLRPFRAAIAAWLDKRGAEAVMVRPDRYVFGTGRPADLVRSYVEHLGLAPAEVI
ncbi:MAG: bifunctional 3-(3-hydroxy-phenyl)propionate/3-hydroxycinnamic acid hydroxylase [Caulobacterales bacterium]